jgi:mannosyltransferase OCH1-like enzyme
MPSGPVRVIHRFWAGREMPAAYAHYEREWKRLNPSYTVTTWTEADVPQFTEVADVVADLYRRDADRKGIELYVQLADVIGYALVEAVGGIYVNCDMQPVRPLKELPPAAWASYENYEDYRIVNAAIGAPSAHDPFWRELLEELPKRYFANPTAEMVETTGPALLTDTVRETRHLFHVLSKETFNPVHWKQISAGGDASAWVDSLPEETIAVHHWGHKKDGRSNVIETATQ